MTGPRARNFRRIPSTSHIEAWNERGCSKIHITHCLFLHVSLRVAQARRRHAKSIRSNLDQGEEGSPPGRSAPPDPRRASARCARARHGCGQEAPRSRIRARHSRLHAIPLTRSKQTDPAMSGRAVVQAQRAATRGGHHVDVGECPGRTYRRWARLGRAVTPHPRCSAFRRRRRSSTRCRGRPSGTRPPNLDEAPGASILRPRGGSVLASSRTQSYSSCTPCARPGADHGAGGERGSLT